MNKVILLFLILTLAIAAVQSVADRKRPARRRRASSSSSSAVSYAGMKRDQALQLFQRSLNIILENTKAEIGQALTRDLKHLIIKRKRNEMFDTHDSFLDRECQGEVDIEGKKLLVGKGWKLFGKYLFKLDGLDMHNSCFVADIVFASIIYD